MKILHAIFVLVNMCICFSANAQLHFDTIYQTDYLTEQFKKAASEKDSASLGKAAFLLSENLKYKNGPTSQILDLLTLSLDCFAAVADSAKYYSVRPGLTDYYIDSKLYGAAEKILMEGRDYYDRKKNWGMKIHMLSRLGKLYEAMGDMEKAWEFKEECHHLNQTVKDTLLEVIYLIDKTAVFHKQNKLDTALVLARQSLALSNAISRSKFAALGLYDIGILNQYKNNLDTAVYYLKKAEKRDRPIEYSNVRLNCFQHLSECFVLKKDYETAYVYLKKYAELNDSILNKRRTEALDKMTLSFATKEKQLAIDALEKEKLLNAESSRQKSFLLFGLSAALAILFALLWLLVRFYREKIRKDKIMTGQTENLNRQKIQSLQNEVQLTAVKAMLEGQENERTRIARDLHDSLGGLLSTIKLKWKNNSKSPDKETGDLLDQAANEVRAISQNLQPSSLQQLGLIPALTDLVNSNTPMGPLPNINFQHYNIPENINPGFALQIYRITQEAFMNTLKHAGASEILIQLNGEANGISILVEDDGNGFDVHQNHSGSGLDNMYKRAEFLQAELTIESTENGTTVFVLCPVVSPSSNFPNS